MVPKRFGGTSHGLEMDIKRSYGYDYVSGHYPPTPTDSVPVPILSRSLAPLRKPLPLPHSSPFVMPHDAGTRTNHVPPNYSTVFSSSTDSTSSASTSTSTSTNLSTSGFTFSVLNSSSCSGSFSSAPAPAPVPASMPSFPNPALQTINPSPRNSLRLRSPFMMGSAPNASHAPYAMAQVHAVDIDGTDMMIDTSDYDSKVQMQGQDQDQTQTQMRRQRQRLSIEEAEAIFLEELYRNPWAWVKGL